MRTHRQIRKIRRATAAALAATLVLSACKQYAPRPVNASAHRDEFLARTPEAVPPQAAATEAETVGLAPTTSEASPEASPAPAPAPSPTPAPAPEPDAAGTGQEPTTLTLADAERVALYFNTGLRRARREAGIAQAAAENGGLWTDPTISLQLTRVLQSTVNPDELFGGVNLSIPISGRLEIEKQRLGLAHAAALADVARLEWNTLMELRRAWVNWTALAQQLHATRDFLSLIGGVTSVVDAMAESGEVARIDARLFRLEQLVATAEVNTLQGQVQRAELSIMQLMGLPPSFVAPLEPVTLNAGPIASLDPSSRSVHDRLLAASPGIQVAKAQYEVAERLLEEEIRKQVPDLQISPSYGEQDAVKQLLLGVSIPLPIFNANRRAIAEAYASREAARVEIEIEVESAIAAAAFRRSELTSAITRRTLFSTQLVPLAELQYSEAREVARLGEFNVLALLEGLKRRKESKLGLIGAQRDEATAAIGISEVLGPSPDQVAGATP